MTPTNVADVQTKRTLRRSASLTSSLSRDSRAAMKRSPSTNSMSERTLRSPSPHRTTATNTPDDAPPVPSIPTHVAKSHIQQASPTRMRNRASSLRTQPLKLGSEVLKEGRASWFGPPVSDPSATMRTSDAAINTPPRPTSASSSINFSYPRSLRISSSDLGTTSATRSMNQQQLSSTDSGSAVVFDPNTRRMVTKSVLVARENSYREPGRSASKKKKKKQEKKKQERAPPPSPTLVPTPDAADEFYLPPPIEDVNKTTSTGLVSDAPELVTGNMYEDMGAEIHVEPEANPPHPSTAGDYGLQVDDHVITGVGTEGISATLFPQSDTIAEDQHQMSPPQNSQPYEIGAGMVTREEPSSVSYALPPRMTAYHRIESPIELPSGDRQLKPPSPRESEILAVPVRHSPPARSASPIKPALKQSTSPNRGSNLSDYGSELSYDQGAQSDQGLSRKKSVRVSFDDRNTVVVGEGAPPVEEPESPVLSPPQSTRKHWYSFGRRREDQSSTEDADDSEVMKPRPPLPHFGSVRDKKFRDHEERPLVRPALSASHTPHSGAAPTLPTIPSVSDLKNNTDFSNDHVIGSLLASEMEKKHEANTSRLREPLPPEVTSVEGDGFMSDGSSTSSLRSSEDEDVGDDSADEGHSHRLSQATGVTLVPEPPKTYANGSTHVGNGSVTSTNGSAAPKSDAPISREAPIGSKDLASQVVPEIAISYPSPQPQAEIDSPFPRPTSSSEHDVFFDIPGTFPDEDDSSSTTTQKQAASASALLVPPPNPSEESEDPSIYSDAYEDLSDIEGDGFMSLDAVVQSPIQADLPAQLTSIEQPQTNTWQANDLSRGVTQTHTLSAPIPVATISTPAPSSLPQSGQDVDWEHAKAYWRGLTSEKRRQLEEEVLSEAGEDADLDDTVTTKKPKKKKSLTEQRVNTTSPVNAPPATEKRAEESPSGDHRRTYQIVPGTKVVDTPRNVPVLRSSMRSSLRSSTAPQSNGPGKTASFGENGSAGSKPHKTVRVIAEPEAPRVGFRKTMRSNNIGRIPEDEETNRYSLRSQRPVSVQSTTGSLRSGNQRKLGHTTRLAASLDEDMSSHHPGNWSQIQPQRRGSMDSDSSFRRSSRPRQAEGVAFRKSMRSNGAAEAPAANGRPDSRRANGFRAGQAEPETRSLRSPVGPETKPRMTLRRDSSDGSIRSASHRFHLPSFGRSSRNSKSSSRLDYSSDEDDQSVTLPPVRAKPERASSDSWVSRRFSGSSSKPVSNTKPLASASAAASAAKGRPLSRGTLREPVEEVSEELSDSTDEDPYIPPRKEPALPSTANARANGNGNGNGKLLAVGEPANGSLRRSRSGRGSIATSYTESANGAPAKADNNTHKHGLMAALRRKKAEPAGRINRPQRMDSAARRDTKLERSTSELEALRSNNTTPRPQLQPKTNALGTRSLRETQSATFHRPAARFGADEDSDSVSTPLEGEESPVEAVNGAASSRYLRKKQPVGRIPEENALSTAVEPRKKKKFMALRRMFGIDD